MIKKAGTAVFVHQGICTVIGTSLWENNFEEKKTRKSIALFSFKSTGPYVWKQANKQTRMILGDKEKDESILKRRKKSHFSARLLYFSSGLNRCFRWQKRFEKR